jgi:hypothetical protein
MRFEELPESVFLVSSPNAVEIAKALREVLEGSLGMGYLHMASITAKCFSGRVLSSEPCFDSMPLDKMYLPTRMAERLILNEKYQARYDPAEHPEQVKGWEIRKAMAPDDVSIAIALPVWLEKIPSRMIYF